jgi:hypothetical protein
LLKIRVFWKTGKPSGARQRTKRILEQVQRSGAGDLLSHYGGGKQAVYDTTYGYPVLDEPL